MNSFEVVSPIKVKGELIKPAKAGEQPNTVELSDKTAQLLLGTKSIKTPSGNAQEVAQKAALLDAAAAEKNRVDALVKRAKELGITHADAIKTEALETLVAEAEATGQANAEPEGHITGAVTFDGNTVELSQMKAEELKKLATDMGIEGAQKMNKADLVAAIKAVPVKPAE